MSSDSVSIVKNLKSLWGHLSPVRRRQYVLLLLLMIVCSFAEIINIGAVLPFLAVFTAPERIYDMPVLKPVISMLGIDTPHELLFPLTLFFGVTAVIAGLLRLLLLWVSTRLTFATGADFSIEIYYRTLYQPYAVHISRNSSEIIDGISVKTTTIIYNVLKPVVTILSSLVILLAIMATILVVSPLVVLLCIAGFFIMYTIIIFMTRRQLSENSRKIATESIKLIKTLQEGLCSIRDVLIDSSQDVYCGIYRQSDLQLRKAQGNNIFIQGSPRIGMESAGMMLIAVMAFILAQQRHGIATSIPVLGVLALGAQRILPLLQQLYASWSAIQGDRESLGRALQLLDQPLPEYVGRDSVEPMPFRHSIVLRNLSFRYSPETPWVIRHINLTIPKGAKIGFIGSTGSGKSTLLDILMGLLQPTTGIIEVDASPVTAENHRAWQRHIAHVPQAIFLADSTIEENIALGVPYNLIDRERVRLAAHQAQLDGMIESLPDKYRTVVGERGVRLSGGQRQRIGIARALYRQADVIIFDEATSALDNETEEAVMQAIDLLSDELTIIIVAHRLTTLRNCSSILELISGTIRNAGTYDDVIMRYRKKVDPVMNLAV